MFSPYAKKSSKETIKLLFHLFVNPFICVYLHSVIPYYYMTVPDEKAEYFRIKKLLHSLPLQENEYLLHEIDDFGMKYNHSKLYSSLKRKYKWHRIYHPGHLPIGKPTDSWVNRQSPLVSVIVPNYNHAAYLHERIDCILNQTFENYEVILLDDCSMDESRDILLSYKGHPKVSHVVLNEHNTGNTFLQWEKGLSLAKGEYVWIAESDDYADESFLSATMTVFCQHQDCVMVRTGSYIVNEKGRVLFMDWDEWKEDETIHYYHGNDYIRHNMLHFNYIYNASMVVFRKDAFQKIDKSYQKYRYTGDWLCWMEMLQLGPICEYRRKLNYFRQHKNKVSKRSSTTKLGFVDELNVLAYAVSHVKMSSLRKLMLRGERYYLYLRWSYNVSDESVKKACFEALTNNLHATARHNFWYKLIKWFDFLPFVPTEKNDKYK